jgi:hypothetical protein
MRTVVAVVVLAVALAGCSSAQEATDTASSAPPAAAPAEPSSAPASAAGDAETTLTAEEAIAAIEAAGLPVGEIRDNSANCEDLEIGCEALITTDYVSAYQWPSPEEAAANEGFGPGRESLVVGAVVLHFGGDSDFWPFDTAPYIDAAERALADQ